MAPRLFLQAGACRALAIECPRQGNAGTREARGRQLALTHQVAQGGHVGDVGLRIANAIRDAVYGRDRNVEPLLPALTPRASGDESKG